MPAKPNNLPLPTDAELDILAVLWRLGPATVREVHDELGKESGYTTTLKQMQLMLGKGLLIRTERFGAHVYEAGIPKEQTQKQIVGDQCIQIGTETTRHDRELPQRDLIREGLDHEVKAHEGIIPIEADQ